MKSFILAVTLTILAANPTAAADRPPQSVFASEGQFFGDGRQAANAFGAAGAYGGAIAGSAVSGPLGAWVGGVLGYYAGRVIGRPVGRFIDNRRPRLIFR